MPIAEEFDSFHYEMRGSNLCAIMHYRTPYIEIGGRLKYEQAFIRESLENRLRNLQAGRYTSEITEAALASWPADEPVGFV